MFDHLGFAASIRNRLMTSRTLRRRLHHGDVDGKRQEHFEALGSDGLNEPLLGDHERDDRQSEVRPHMGYSFFSWLKEGSSAISTSF